MTEYLSRSAWTPTSASGSAFVASNVDQINVHYPASGNVNLAGLSQANVASRLRGWRTYHITGNKWSDIGYNFAIDGSGRVWELRGWRVGAHAASASNPNQNRRAVGVLFVLGNNEQPTAKQLEAFRHFRTTRVLARYSKATRVVGHGQVPGASTSCPGAPLRAAISRGDLTKKPGGTTPPPTPTPPPQEDDMTPAEREALARRAGEWAAELTWQKALKSLVDGKDYPAQNFLRAVHKQTDWTGLRTGIEGIVNRLMPGLFAKHILGYKNPAIETRELYTVLRTGARDAAVARALAEQQAAKGAALTASEVSATIAEVNEQYPDLPEAE